MISPDPLCPGGAAAPSVAAGRGGPAGFLASPRPVSSRGLTMPPRPPWRSSPPESGHRQPCPGSKASAERSATWWLGSWAARSCSAWSATLSFCSTCPPGAVGARTAGARREGARVVSPQAAEVREPGLCKGVAVRLDGRRGEKREAGALPAERKTPTGRSGGLTALPGPSPSPEGGPAAQRASPAEQRSEPPPTDRRRPMAGQRSRSGPSGWLGTADARAEQRRPLVFFVPEQLPSRASQAAGGLCKGPPAPDKPAQAVADGRRWHEAGLRESGSLPRQRALIAGPPGGQ
ncbi:transmembrane protein 272 isoform X1 [Crotalus tigris]|uniref:transmembrane protein 272 isoform X1 n=1 Tax=Crotalus tigris TaxID=88082 RepID=UPI00192F3465|nr:transmembrane protein 272 isoform X1 [Crotalus tigris]XP_039180699.1 transmembrane protein 272 isoform X1 [Crotalus tigris]